jgi:hypothetical protein
MRIRDQGWKKLGINIPIRNTGFLFGLVYIMHNLHIFFTGQGTAASIRNPEASRGLLSTYLAQQIGLLTEKDGADLDESLLEALHSSVLRICDLTGLGQEEGLGRLMVELAGRYTHQAGRYTPALRLARLLVDAPVTPAWAHMLQTVVYSLLVEMGSSNNSTKAGLAIKNPPKKPT